MYELYAWDNVIKKAKKKSSFYELLKESSILKSNEYELHIEFPYAQAIDFSVLFSEDFNNFIRNEWKKQIGHYVRVYFYQAQPLTDFGISEYTYHKVEKFFSENEFEYTPETTKIYSDMFYSLYLLFNKKVEASELLEIYFEFFFDFEENCTRLNFNVVYNFLKNDFRTKNLYISEIHIWAFVIFNGVFMQNSDFITSSWIKEHCSTPDDIMRLYEEQKNKTPYKAYLENIIHIDNKNLQKHLHELNSLIGMENVKSFINSFVNLVKIYKLRREKKLPEIPLSFHMLFIGNPGTGKTTVARCLAKIYKELGILKSGHLVEVDRSDLIGKYIGETENKTKEIIEKSLDGILFIDEAYALTTEENSKDYGKEVINILVKAMEDYRERLIVIAAGYPEEMQTFINSNPGLKSRFSNTINFNDYLPSELLDIFRKLCRDYDMIINKDTEDALLEIFERSYINENKNFGNARVVRNLFEKAHLLQANRLANFKEINKEDLLLLSVEDIKMASLKK